MMNTLANMGLAGSAVLLLWLLASKLLKNRLPARWHYRILKTSLFFFLVPVGRLLPLAERALAALAPAPAPAAPAPAPVQAVPHIPVAVIPQITAPAPAPAPTPEPFALSAEDLRVLAVLWALGAAAMLLYKLYVYLRLRRRVFSQNRPVSSPEAQLAFWSCRRQLGIRGAVALRENPAVRSPFAAGLSRPTVVIPAVSLQPEELRYLFLHELTHIKYGDLWVRLLSMSALILHWYNPLAYLLCRSVQTVSEQSCDERIACPLSPAERYVYGNVILKLAAAGTAGAGDWAASLSTRESIERRLTRVLRTEKLKGCKRLLALALAVAILACGGGAALAAKNPLPVSKKTGEKPRTIPTVQTEPAETGDEAAPAPAAAAPAAVTAPTEAQVLEAREQALEGMTKKQIRKLTETITAANLCLEQEYFYNDLFGKLADPDSLYWNYFHKTGEIQIGWAYDGKLDMETVCQKEGLTEEEFYAKYGKAVKATNRYDADAFNALLETLGGNVRNEHLKAALQYIMDETALARETHAMEHANNLYQALHDLDYFLLRYGPTDVGPYAQDDSTVSKYYGTLAAFYGASAQNDASASAPSAGAGVPAASNGSLSAEFLKELYACYSDPKYGVTEESPVLLGDKELILSRGGTLLPDEDVHSYTLTYGPRGSDTPRPNTIYKTFISKVPEAMKDLPYGGWVIEEYKVGNKEAYLASIPSAAFNQLDELVNGEYPKNSKGESYGSAYPALVKYVGYAPDLECIGHFPHVNSPLGYIRRVDEYRYVGLPEEECPHTFPIPLYNAEGEVIGKWKDARCSGHPDNTFNKSPEEAKAALAEKSGASPTYGDPGANTLTLIRAAFKDQGATAETPVLFGNPELIRSRGGTLYPDADISAYRMRDDGIHKLFLDKDNQLQDEYLVGNKNAVDSREAWMLDTLTPDGDYPKNKNGESYGHVNLFSYVGYWPDLEHLAETRNRPEGYIYSRDDAGSPLNRYDPNAAQKPRTQTGSAAYKAWRAGNPSSTAVPLYDSEGTIIGSYDFGSGSGPDTSGMSVEEAKAALEESAPPAGAETAAIGDVTVSAWVSTTPGERWSPFQEEDWIKYTASALRCDAKLVRSVGGTVLPDDEKTSYAMVNGWFFKQYKDKNGIARSENELRNPEWIEERYRWVLDTLVDGEYAKNSKGETYGVKELANYVGYYPDWGISFSAIRDTHTLPTDFAAYERLTDKEQTYCCPLNFDNSTMAEIDARKAALRNGQ